MDSDDDGKGMSDPKKGIFRRVPPLAGSGQDVSQRTRNMGRPASALGLGDGGYGYPHTGDSNG
jgi:hypothetical protein